MSAELRDALLAAASEVHADAGSVLSSAPDTKDAAPLGWLRLSPGADGGDLETHVAVALFWGLFRAERRAAKARRQAAAEDVRSPARSPSAAASARDPATPSSSSPAVVTVVSAYGLERRLTPLELAAALADAIHRTRAVAASWTRAPLRATAASSISPPQLRILASAARGLASDAPHAADSSRATAPSGGTRRPNTVSTTPRLSTPSRTSAWLSPLTAWTPA